MPYTLPVATASRTTLLAGLAVAILALLLASFYRDLLISRVAVGRLALPAVVAAATALAIVGVGRAARSLVERRLFPEWVAAPPRLRYDFLIGYPLFGVVCFLAGLGSTGAAVQGLVLIGAMLLGAIALTDYRFARDPRWLAPPVSGVWILAGGTALLIALLHAQAPAFTLDEVAYHLAVPAQWVLEGHAVELPLLSHSYFPLAIESADLPALSLLGPDGAIASHFVHLAAAAASFAVLVRAIPGALALPAALAIATAPALFLTAGWSWNEQPLVGLTVIAAIAARSLAERDEEGPGPAVLALALAGGALTKYTFFPAAVVLIATLALIHRRERARLGTLLRVVLIAALLGSVFLVRNLVLTGNATAPFLEPHAPAVGGYRLAGTFAETIAGYLFSPRLIDEALGPALPALAFAALLLMPLAGRFGRLVTAGFAGVVIAMLAAAPSSRILVPFLVVPAAIAARELSSVVEGRRLLAGTLSLLLFVAVALQLHLALFYTDRIGAVGLFAGRTDPAELVAAQRRDARTIAAVDALLPEDSRTLVIGTAELFGFSHRVRGGGNFDGPRIAALLRSPDLRERLRREGITHLAVFRGGISREAAPLDPREEERVTRLDTAAATALDELLQRDARPVGGFGDAVLYELAR